MGFSNGSYAKVWKVTDEGNYHNVQLSISRKNKQSGKYEQDFSGFARFVGKAHNQAKDLREGDSIRLGNVDTTNRYDKEKKMTFTNHVVFEYSMPDGNNSVDTNVGVEEDDEEPF